MKLKQVSRGWLLVNFMPVTNIQETKSFRFLVIWKIFLTTKEIVKIPVTRNYYNAVYRLRVNYNQ
jgi:hypothetical protein